MNQNPTTTNPLPAGSGFNFAHLRAQQIAAAIAKRAEARREVKPLDWRVTREELRRRRDAELRLPPMSDSS
ncbi:hypothetical protein HMPREF0298_1694 [Corynebacterium lipophiloflavum DSM 44291]|uniref:Uncharacterized protein n=1 Tax=Corynebacterium lipophiloflavum (strain ATCC 700352 / DSM 44291 / CCUG 37336 / JCM 10383 / DMMZ 1944) TaxID=525263 RepID=C0XTC4_CORLD|nr:hypothetical protein HMPREF0298_1694 [Corynebacterium lipophiloflavum DSM 44291]